MVFTTTHIFDLLTNGQTVVYQEISLFDYPYGEFQLIMVVGTTEESLNILEKATRFLLSERTDNQFENQRHNINLSRK